MGRQRGEPGARPGGKGLPPSERPSKVCPECGRPFSWRKKWAAVWEQVIYCSDRCRARGRSHKKPAG
jgi:hypothetical protein